MQCSAPALQQHSIPSQGLEHCARVGGLGKDVYANSQIKAYRNEIRGIVVLSMQAFIYIFGFTIPECMQLTVCFHSLEAEQFMKDRCFFSPARKNSTLQVRRLGRAFQNIKITSVFQHEDHLQAFTQFFMLTTTLFKRKLKGWLVMKEFIFKAGIRKKRWRKKHHSFFSKKQDISSTMNIYINYHFLTLKK